MNVTALREIKLLKELNDPNIIELVDVYPHKRNLHLVFPFMESDLEAVIRDRNIFLSPADYKSYMQMTLKGLAVCHKKWILHRYRLTTNIASSCFQLPSLTPACYFSLMPLSKLLIAFFSWQILRFLFIKVIFFPLPHFVSCRDMKPNNLLLGSDGQLKLADFGLARIFGSPDRRFTHQVTSHCRFSSPKTC